MSHKFKALVRLSEDLGVEFSVDDATYICYKDSMKNYFDSNFGVKIEPKILKDTIKLESVKRISDGGVVYPVRENENKKWFSQHILSVTEEGFEVPSIDDTIDKLNNTSEELFYAIKNEDNPKMLGLSSDAITTHSDGLENVGQTDEEKLAEPWFSSRAYNASQFVVIN